MEVSELDLQLDELETRVERLRALYEQYFLGIEKIEPSVARKDVERRIWLLRKQQIRNTGKRFRLQTIIQRYNTFAQYWMRICREIENGTYRRHLLRASKNLAEFTALTTAAKKRLGLLRKAAKAGEESAEATAQGDAGEEARPEVAPDLAALAAEAEPAVEALVGTRPVPGESALAARGSELRPSISESPLDAVKRAMDQVLGESLPPGYSLSEHLSKRPGRVSQRARPEQPVVSGRPLPPLPTPPVVHSSAPVPSRAPATPGARDAAAAAPRTPPAVTLSHTVSVEPLATPARRVAPPLPPLPAPPPRSAPAPTGDQPGSWTDGPAAGAGSPSLPPRRVRVPGSVVLRSSVPPPRPPAATSQKPSVAGRAGQQPSGADRGSPAAAARPQGPGELSEARIRELHGQLLSAKRSVKDEGAVSMEGLAKSLRSAVEKLRQQHGTHRQVEFEVVVKNGRAIVKPIVR